MREKMIDKSIVITFAIAAFMVIMSYTIVNYYSGVQLNSYLDQVKTTDILW